MQAATQPYSPTVLSILGEPALIHSCSMHALLAQLQRVAASDTVVLVSGETGTGKELIARALHQYSHRRAGPWVDISCTTLPEHLVESELFGYEKGAFSGAIASKPGLFEMARGGTVLLDEIGDMDGRMQAKLLRALDHASYYRLGGTRKVRIEARVVAATNRDLAAGVARGEFREDLYHRLNQVTLEVPPLRERPEDIVPLADFFLEQVKPSHRWTSGAHARLESYRWPGNVREVRNVVVKTALLAEENPLGEHLLPRFLRQDRWGQSEPRGAISDRQPPCWNLERNERRLIGEALRQTGGRKRQAAELLGISRRTLHRKLAAYALE